MDKGLKQKGKGTVSIIGNKSCVLVLWDNLVVQNCIEFGFKLQMVEGSGCEVKIQI